MNDKADAAEAHDLSRPLPHLRRVSRPSKQTGAKAQLKLCTRCQSLQQRPATELLPSGLRCPCPPEAASAQIPRGHRPLGLSRTAIPWPSAAHWMRRLRDKLSLEG